MAENSSSLKRKSKSPVFKHVIDNRESISQNSSSSAQTLVSDGESMKTITRNRLSSSSDAASSIGHCADLFTLILLRLPPKYLLRFQCVSKQWRLIISDPDFRRLHGRTFHKCRCCFSPDSDALLLYRPLESQLNFISLSGENVKAMDSITTGLVSLGFGEISRLHSCNGLLCIDFLLDYDIRQFIVYNPATGHYRSIPDTEIVKKFGFPSDINICFDPLKSDHYKVLFICQDPDDQTYNFVVYSSETRNWKDSVSSMEYPDDNLYFGNGILWNGKLHWISNERYILCFDMNKESLNWSVPSLPMHGREQRRMECWYFGESGGCLCAILMNPNQPMLFHVYNLQERYCSSSSSSSAGAATAEWLLKVSIDLNPLSISYPSMLAKEYYPRFHFPHFIWSFSNHDHHHNKKMGMGKLVISIARKFILYDISEKTVMELVDLEPVDQNYSWKDMYHWSQTVTFTPTLASV